MRRVVINFGSLPYFLFWFFFFILNLCIIYFYQLKLKPLRFKVCPEIFYQLHTLHVNIGHACIPRVQGLLPNKTKESYDTFFQKVKDLLESLEPENLMTDFEPASFSDIFPSANVTGCYFHFCNV